MSDIETIIKWIVDYGISIIIVAIFLYVIIRLLNIFFQYLTGKLKKPGKEDREEHDRLLAMRSDIGRKIQALLEEFFNAHTASRIQVMEFSNTNTSVAYLPFRYMTCTYEVYQLGLPASGHKIDRISTSLFIQFFNAIRGKDYLEFDIQDKGVLVGGAMCDIMKEEGASRALCTMLRTSKGKSIGYLSMKKDEPFTEEDIEDIQILGHKITTLLSVADQ